MKWKTYIPLAVAIVLGLFAARIAMTLVKSAPVAMTPTVHLTDAFVAARDIEPGTTLADTDLTPAKLASESLPAGAFTSPAQAVGRVTKIALVRGQTITPNLLADDGAGYGVGATLPAGFRAITVDITDTTGVAGFILPKCRVDVIATIQVDGKSIAKTVLEAVQVLAVGTRTNPTAPNDADPNRPQSKTVTLLVKPKDVEKVELAATMSRIRLVLRNGRDETQAESDGLTLADLRGKHDVDPFGDSVKTVSSTQPSESAKPQTLSWTVTTIKAGVSSQQTFEVPLAPTPTDRTGEHDYQKITDVREHN